MDRLVGTRFSELFLRYHRRRGFERFLHGPGNAVVRLWWAGLNRLMPRLVGMPRELVPETRLPLGFENAGIGGEIFSTFRKSKKGGPPARGRGVRPPPRDGAGEGGRG